MREHSRIAAVDSFLARSAWATLYSKPRACLLKLALAPNRFFFALCPVRNQPLRGGWSLGCGAAQPQTPAILAGGAAPRAGGVPLQSYTSWAANGPCG